MLRAREVRIDYTKLLRPKVSITSLLDTYGRDRSSTMLRIDISNSLYMLLNNFKATWRADKSCAVYYLLSHLLFHPFNFVRSPVYARKSFCEEER